MSNELIEYRATDSVVAKQAKAAAELIRNSKHFVAFSGAGISTSTGISDFRGPKGVWTLRDKGAPLPKPKRMEMIPTTCHMSLVELANRGILKQMISQNTDGLHARSGLNPVTQLCELHGNRNAARCNKCGNMTYHNLMVRLRTNHVHDHRTGVKCSKCKSGILEDTIVNFGENLPEEVLDRAYEHMGKADVVLVLGTSMKVTPACDLPKIVVKRGGSMILVNLQETPADGYASVRVFKETDIFMKLLMENLDMPIPPWTVDFDISLTSQQTKSHTNVTINSITQKTLVLCSNPSIAIEWSNKESIDAITEADVDIAAEATFAGMLEGDKSDKVVVPPPPRRAKGILAQMHERRRKSGSKSPASSNSPPKSPSPPKTPTVAPNATPSTSKAKGARRPQVPRSVKDAPHMAATLPWSAKMPVFTEGNPLLHLTLRWHDLYTTLPEGVSPLHLSFDPTHVTNMTVRATWNSHDHSWSTK